MSTSFLNQLSQIENLEDGLRFLSENFKDKIVFSTSFGIEDQVISHAVFHQKLKNVETFTLDTGRLFPETYAVWDKTLLQYNQPIRVYYPDADDLETYVNQNGINGFYNSVSLRKECCHIRKVVPLKKALKGAKIWITGLRAEQSDNRNDFEIIQWDEQNQLYKYNPLLYWTTDEVLHYLKQKGVPYNTLHDQNFISIGCAPCTRAVRQGEDFRAGRWWWEDQTKKECGLHQ
ncbi:phosphoadenylyl-sulfate reductase [Flavobacterium amnicola]|uniref:Adenosine 5'-phosphosulfate reductase n=1 Tax=Flavobacterium amnicola TaxID=2506422 RepID=A0A4Q1K6N3_9FLAO|nr:phosphoadenylyl-sulfate reductase [Flavobacterium amnicola]RXR21337.1 phosphoadenylyl-sulfate reductase [Flavobacterium amnicola]